jgi:hypothetical protein
METRFHRAPDVTEMLRQEFAPPATFIYDDESIVEELPDDHLAS